jgi:[acyl-carrier-protein] S-malonyltransferase
MGRALRDAVPAVEKNLRRLDSLLGYPLSEMMDGPEELLFPHVASPTPTVFMEVTMALALAAAAALREAGVEPDAVAGRSMGEYSAGAFAGIFSEADCFRMVKEVTLKGQQDCLETPSSLVTVYGLDRKELLSVAARMEKAGRLCEIVSFYDKARVGMAGLRNSDLPALRSALRPFRHRISVSREVGAFHSTLFRRLASRSREFFSGIRFSSPRVPVYMNLDAAKEKDPEGVRDKLAGALVSPVLWQETVGNMLADGVRNFVEMAPGAMLTEFICDLPDDAVVLRTDTPANFKRALKVLGAR